MPTAYKIRRHYSEFVLELYRGVWEETQRRMAAGTEKRPLLEASPSIPWTRALRDRWLELLKRDKLPTSWARSPGAITGGSVDPPISYVLARRLVLRHWLLVLDEVQLLDVSSAGLLAETLLWFWRMGGVVVGTSNAIPEDLYRQGTQRERLEPFLEALKARSPVVELRSKQDWREARAAKSMSHTWFTSGQERDFEEKLRAVAPPQEFPQPIALSVFTRRLDVPWASGKLCKFTFDELCNEVRQTPTLLFWLNTQTMSSPWELLTTSQSLLHLIPSPSPISPS
jgi:peroxisome-assembly ATPase